MRWIGFLCAVLLAAGCASTKVDGVAYSQPSYPVDVLALVFDDTGKMVPTDSPGKPGSAMGLYVIKKEERKMATAVRERFPAIFAANGVELQVYTRSADAARLQNEGPPGRHILYLTPTAGTYEPLYRKTI